MGRGGRRRRRTRGVVRVPKEKISDGQKGDVKFEDKVGRKYSISRGEAKLYRGVIQVKGVQGGTHSVTSGDKARGSSKSESC